MGQRNLRRGGGAQSGSHTRHDLAWNIGVAQRINFFSRTTEDERVAALQANDTKAGICERNHEEINFLLADLLGAGSFTNVVHLRCARNELQYFRCDQVVVQDGVRRFEQTQRFHSKQLWIARSRANQINFSVRAPVLCCSFMRLLLWQPTPEPRPARLGALPCWPENAAGPACVLCPDRWPG